jgi:UDP-2,4-diacetamido-2,4,6-trideoxy-beta-L-altropyranose hydrolase
MVTEEGFIIRADATPYIGTGHLMRCLALAQWARRENFSVRFISRVSVPWVVEKLRHEGIALTQLEGDVPTAEAPDSLLAQLGTATSGTWVVLDGYHFGPDCQKAVRAAGYKLLVVDDYAHLPEYHCDILLNQNIGAKEFVYKGDVGQKLLGPRYALLRPEFLAARAKAEERRFPEKPRNILLTLGGGDFSEHLARIASDFSIPELAACILHVIAGVVPQERIRELLRNCPAKVEILSQVDDMPALLLDADLCITGGGSTCWELCCLGVPFLTVKVAENQRGVVAGLSKLGVGEPFTGEWFRLFLQTAVLRREAGFIGRTVVTGEGVKLTLAHIGVCTVTLRQATPSDSYLIWQLANDPAVRGVSRNSRPISWEEHLLWYRAQLGHSLPFWVVEGAGGEVYGYVRFAEGAENRVVVSIALMAEERGKGIGTEALRQACHRFWERFPIAQLEASILDSNMVSQGMFRKESFNLAGEEQVAGRRFLLFFARKPCGGDNENGRRQ